MSSGKVWYFWVIRTVRRHRVLFGPDRRIYFAKRTSLKNPRHLTTFHDNVKLFTTKEKALDYYMQKARSVSTVEQCTVVRIKFFVTYHNYSDYWKNSAQWEKRYYTDSLSEYKK